MTPRTQRIVLVVAIAALIAGAFAAAGVLSQKLFEQPREPTPGRPRLARSLREADRGDPALFRVGAIQGQVECERAGARYALRAGDLLSREDVVRTADGAYALLSRAQTVIELRENIEIRVESLAEQTARFGLLSGAGNVSANVGDSRETLEIKTGDTSAVNQGASRWVVALDPRGKVSVAVSKGEVRFTGAGRTVNVPAGSESTARPDAAPSDPTRIPEELLLSVIWPELPRNEPHADITGKVRPSSRVRVNGAPVEVNDDGSFVTPVQLRVGDNKVDIEAEDITGRKKTTTGVVKRAATAPTLEANPEDLWK